MRLVLSVLFALASALPATAMTFDFGNEAAQTYHDAEDATTVRIATGPWQAGTIAERLVEGRVETTAWKITTEDSTHQLLSRLTAQIENEGWTPLFSCETTACGGFDFRFALPLVHEPDMHVDLGDFRYLAAERDGAVLSLLVSRARIAAFVQLTLASPTPPDAPATPPSGTIPVEEAQPPVPNPGGSTGEVGTLLARQGSVVLDDLVFASGEARLEPGSYASLAALVTFMAENPEARVALVGHTDASGSLQGNIALSRARAQAARQALIDLGTPADRITAEGVGHLAPRVSNQTAEGRAQNRRVEAMLTSTRTGTTP